jgi:hypothetical protein
MSVKPIFPRNQANSWVEDISIGKPWTQIKEKEKEIGMDPPGPVWSSAPFEAKRLAIHLRPLNQSCLFFKEMVRDNVKEIKYPFKMLLLSMIIEYLRFLANCRKKDLII